MSLDTFAKSFLGAITIVFISACGAGGDGSLTNPSSSPASAEPAYYGTATDIADAQAVTVTIPAKFLYRKLDFTPGSSTNGLSSVVAYTATPGTPQAVEIAFAEFHVYDSTGKRVQQGETTTTGLAIFKIPKVAGNYTLKVFSRALNSYLKVSVLEDIYNNNPYSISKSFTIDSTDIANGTKDLRSSPVYAEADESKSPKIEGGAFNIMYNILLANEYIRRNIGKNNSGIPSTNTNLWWVADKVTVFWKAGFNPYTYFGGSGLLSFYTPGQSKLYILGGSNGDVAASDTDHFDDSIILHEYGHFLEDLYGYTQSPGGSHNGNFVIDPRLSWSEGWANYFQSAVLTGADAFDNSASESRMPTAKRYHYYVDTYGYKGSRQYGIGIAFNLADYATSGAFDNVSLDSNDAGIFREVSISRTLYKGTRDKTAKYPDTSGTGNGGGISFATVWKTFSGEDTSGYTRSNPAPYSLRNYTKYPLPNAGLFNWMLERNGVNRLSNNEWNSILTEERQTVGTKDYAYFLQTSGSACPTSFANVFAERYMPSDPVPRSDLQGSNDFYLYYHNGAGGSLTLDYSTSNGNIDLDLIIYNANYIYFEDYYWYAGKSSPYIAKQSRSVAGTAENVSLSGLSAGYYLVNVKANMYNKTNQSGPVTYNLKKDGVPLCGQEQL